MLTTSQRTTLLAAIKADPTAGPLRAAGDTYSLRAWLNGPSGVLAWRTAVPAQDSDEVATYTSYDTLAQGKRDSWSIFLRFNRDFTRNKVRNWIVDVWGAATASSIAESILQAGTENATRAQNTIGGTTKTTGTVTALARTFADAVSQDDANWFVAQA